MSKELDNQESEQKNRIEKLTAQANVLQATVDKLGKQYEENYKKNVTVQENAEKTVIELNEREKKIFVEQAKLTALKKELDQKTLESAGKTQKELEAILQMRSELKVEQKELEKQRKETQELTLKVTEREKNVTDDEIDLGIRKKELVDLTEDTKKENSEAKEALKKAKSLENQANSKSEEAEKVRQAYTNKLADLEKSFDAKSKKAAEDVEKLKTDYESKAIALRTAQLNLKRANDLLEKNEQDFNARKEDWELKHAPVKNVKKDIGKQPNK